MGEVFVGSFNAARGMKSPETGANAVATPLSNRDVRFISSTLFGDGKKPAVLSKETSEWVDKRIHGVSYKGVNVLTVDWDPVYEPVHDALFHKFITSPGLSSVVVEYFTPELSAKVNKLPIVGPLLEKATRGGDPADPDKKGRLTYVSQYKRRLQTANLLSNTLAEANKKVLCFDIANKPTYMLLRETPWFIQSTIGKELGKSIDASELTKGIDTKGAYRRAGALLPVAWYAVKLGMQALRKGIYNPKDLSVFDTYQLHLEDARRLIIAEGITQHIDRKVAAGELPKGSTMLVVYPEAHNLRIRNYMERITKKDGGLPLKVKDLAYRLVSDPILEFKERSYEFTGNQWHKTGSSKITRQA